MKFRQLSRITLKNSKMNFKVSLYTNTYLQIFTNNLFYSTDPHTLKLIHFFPYYIMFGIQLMNNRKFNCIHFSISIRKNNVLQVKIKVSSLSFRETMIQKWFLHLHRLPNIHVIIIQISCVKNSHRVFQIFHKNLHFQLPVIIRS